MTEILTDIEIEASAGRVWEVLTDFAAYPEWNPLVRAVRGTVSPGTRPEVHARLWNLVTISFRPTVLVAEAGRELRWRAHFLFPALLAALHSFAVEPLGERRVRFIQREVYSGVFKPLALLLIASSNRRGFAAMNQALKTRAELRS